MTKFNQLIFRFDSIQHQFYDKYVFCPTKYIDIFAPILTIFREQFIHNIWNFCCNFDVISIRIIIHCCKLLICFRQFELKVIKFDNRIGTIFVQFWERFWKSKNRIIENSKYQALYSATIYNISSWKNVQNLIIWISSPPYWKMIHWIHWYVKYNVYNIFQYKYNMKIIVQD